MAGDQMKQRRDTASGWNTNNRTLAAGEIGWESDTRKIKFGDGSTPWNALPYIAYLPVGGKAADSEKIDGYDSSELVLLTDVTTTPAASKIARRTADGGLYVTDATEDTEAATLLQVKNAIVTARQRGYNFAGNAAYTLALSDIGKVVAVGNTGGINTVLPINIPKNTTTPFPVGTVLDISAVGGTGTLRLTPASGVTLAGDGRIYGGGSITIVQTVLDYWLVVNRNDPPGSFARCFAYMADNVTGWAQYWNHIPLNAEQIDTHNGHLTGAITGSDTDTTSRTNRYTCQPGQAGDYKVSGQCSITIGTASTIHCRILKNGTFFRGGAGFTQSTASGGVVQTGDKIITLAEGDWVSMQGWCSNANWNSESGETASGGGTSWMAVQRIS